MPDLQGDAAPAWAANMEERITAGVTTQITNMEETPAEILSGSW